MFAGVLVGVVAAHLCFCFVFCEVWVGWLVVWLAYGVVGLMVGGGGVELGKGESQG